MLETTDENYTEHLLASGVWWKKLLNVQAPYRWNLKRLSPGFMLDIGCGVGRNLIAVDGVGIDHNPHSVGQCHARGLKAFLPDAFRASEWARPGRFDSILLAHVAEHMRQVEVTALLNEYLPYLRADGKLILITPQEWAFRRDPTHVEFVDFEGAFAILRSVGFEPVSSASFPFPRSAGKLLPHSEFVVVGTRPRRH